MLDSDNHIEKIDRQIEERSFQRLYYNPLDEICKEVTTWTKKWKQNKVLDNSWFRFIETFHVNSGKVYSLIKKHKAGNLVSIIASGYSTVIENLSIFVEKKVWIQKF